MEYETDVEEERGRVQVLLENLRIEAQVLVFWLASGDLPTYEIIVNGKSNNKIYEDEVENCLKGQEWWDEMQKTRGSATTASNDLADIASNNWPEASFLHGRGDKVERFLGFRRLLKQRRRHSLKGLTKLGVSLGMRTQRLEPDVMSQHATQWSASEDSESESDSDSDLSVTENESENQSAASEGDLDDYESEIDVPELNVSKILYYASSGTWREC